MPSPRPLHHPRLAPQSPAPRPAPRHTPRRAPRRTPLMALAALVGLALLSAPARALAAPEEEEFPVTGSVSTSVAFNHGVFHPSAERNAGSAYNLPAADGFGWAVWGLSAGLSYNWEFSKDYSAIFVSGNVSFEQALMETMTRASTPTTQPYEVNISDIGLSLGWTLPKVDEWVKRLNANISLDFSVPSSRASRASGVLSSVNGTFSLGYATPIKLVFQGFASAGFNVLTSPTQQVDCELMPQYCAVSGADLGWSNSLFSWAGGLNAQYPLSFLHGLRVGLGYSIFGGYSAATFDGAATDALASPYAQSGHQVSMPMHRLGFALFYGFNRTASAAQQALNQSLQGQDQEEDSELLKRLSLRLGVGTMQRLYSADNTRVTFPLFDFETLQAARTSYSLSVQLAF
ncbi:MAG: hypothetical protein FJ138_16290 [Deltaproteobacteria bacterium]|nr:hypothetical protein [Deltaproteobacteria bacterium]